MILDQDTEKDEMDCRWDNDIDMEWDTMIIINFY